MYDLEAHHCVRNIMYVFTYQYLHSLLVVLKNVIMTEVRIHKEQFSVQCGMTLYNKYKL